MPLPPIAAIEIGTTRTVVLVGESSDEGRINIIGMGVYPSTGVRKGQIIDLALARGGVEVAIKQAEETSEVKVRQALLAVTGGYIEAVVNHGAIPVRSRDRVVSREDVDEVIEIAKAISLAPDREVLHTIHQNFALDDQGEIHKPEGMQGARLAVDVLQIHGVRNRLDNAIHVVRGLQLEVQDVVFGGLAAALAVLTPEQKRSGVAVIDLGGGTTSYLAYAGGVVAAAGSFGVGGDHITNDLALAFNIPMARAEDIKRQEGCALIDPEAGQRRVVLPQEVGFAERSVSLKALHTVINARQEETLRLVRSALDAGGILPHLGAGLVLTGGGAHLRRIPELVQRVFGLPSALGVPANVTGLTDVEAPAAFATAAGLVLYGFKTIDETGMLSPIRNWFKGVFKR